MIIGEQKKQIYSEYAFIGHGKALDFESLKKRFNLQIVLEGERKEQIFLYSNGIIVIEEKENHVEYKEYRKTQRRYWSTSLDELKNEKKIKDAQLTESVMYNDDKLYCEY